MRELKLPEVKTSAKFDRIRFQEILKKSKICINGKMESLRQSIGRNVKQADLLSLDARLVRVKRSASILDPV